MVITDVFDFAPSSRQYLDNGFLRVTGKAARTGVYQYLASEITPEPLKPGEVDSPSTAVIRAMLTDRAPNSIVNVLRSADEVFNADSLATYSNVDVTNNHPTKLVDSTTFKDTSVGHVIGAKQSGDFVDISMIIKDAQAIADIESGKAQLSPGYKTTYIAETGTYDATGETYEFKQTGIDVNHVAIVKRGRGGAQVRIDDNQGVPTMFKVILDSGQALEVADEASAKLVTDTIKDLTQKVNDAEAKMSKAEAEKDAAEEKLLAEKEKTTDAAISARVLAISTTRDAAIKIAGDKFTCDSLATVDVQRAALAVKRPAVDWSDKSEVYVQAAFDMAIADAEAEPAQSTNAEQIAQFSKDAAGIVTDEKPKLTRAQAYSVELSTKWSNK